MAYGKSEYIALGAVAKQRRAISESASSAGQRGPACNKTHDASGGNDLLEIIMKIKQRWQTRTPLVEGVRAYVHLECRGGGITRQRQVG